MSNPIYPQAFWKSQSEVKMLRRKTKLVVDVYMNAISCTVLLDDGGFPKDLFPPVHSLMNY